MMNFSIIVAVLLLGATHTVFAQQSVATLFFPSPTYSSLYLGSIVESDATATTYTFACAPGKVCPLPTPFVWTAGPSTVAYTHLFTVSLNPYSGIEHTVTFPAGPQTEIWTCSVTTGATATTGICVDDWHGPWSNHITTVTITSDFSQGTFVINLTTDLAAVVAAADYPPTTTSGGFTLLATDFAGFVNPTGITVTIPYSLFEKTTTSSTYFLALSLSTRSETQAESTGTSETGVRTVSISELTTTTTLPVVVSTLNSAAMVTKAPWIGAALGVAALAF